MTDDDPRLARLAAEAAELHQAQRALIALEAAIGQLLATHPAPYVVSLLRDQAQHIEDHG